MPKKRTTEEFINKSKELYGDKYDYSKVNYVNARTKVLIQCSIHGAFEQTPLNHLSGTGCPLCAVESRRKSLEDFKTEASAIHNNKYSYDKVEYKNNRTKVCITCPVHGDFWQIPTDHLRGIGCLLCRSSHLEENVRNLLIDNDISFEEQKTWEWLIYKNNQYVDFYIPEYNTAIECQGIQHFEPIGFFGGLAAFNQIVEKDKNKFNLCTSNGVNIIYYSNLGNDYNYSYSVITDLKNLINEIKKFSPTN